MPTTDYDATRKSKTEPGQGAVLTLRECLQSVVVEVIRPRLIPTEVPNKVALSAALWQRPLFRAGSRYGAVSSLPNFDVAR